MALKRVQIVGHTTANLNAFVGRAREISVDTTLNELALHTGGGAATHKRILNKTQNDALYQPLSATLTAIAAAGLTPDQALQGKRTDFSTPTSLAASTRYRVTASTTGTLPTFAADGFLIVEFGQGHGIVATIARNSQTIDGASANYTAGRHGDIVLFHCTSVGVVVTKHIGFLPNSKPLSRIKTFFLATV